MKYLNLIIFIVVYNPLVVCCQNSDLKGTGLIFDDASYQNAPRLSPALRFSDENTPSVYSLRKFCPTAGNQGYMGSCASWATGYAALTISYAVKYNLTSQAEIDQHAKSALFIYNQLKRPDEEKDPCGVGLNLESVMQFLINNGDCEFKDFNPKVCDVRPSEENKMIARNFPIEGYNKLFELGDTYEKKISSVLSSISQNKPVVAGFTFVNSLRRAKHTGIWKPAPEEVPDGGHAMCIVGYDNKNQLFEIMNSWDQDFGDKGFFMMSYKDFSQYCRYGYNINLGYTKEEQDKMLRLSGGFYFKKFLRVDDNNQKSIFSNLNAFLQGNYYTFGKGSVKKDDFFRLIISNMQKDCYLYVFSLKPDHTSEILFPLSASDGDSKINDIPLIPGNARVELPADDSRAYSTDISGDDTLCLLYSNQKIDDIKAIVSGINNSQGELLVRLQKTLGDRLVPSDNVKYNASNMYFSATTLKGNIVPIVLKVSVE